LRYLRQFRNPHQYEDKFPFQEIIPITAVKEIKKINPGSKVIMCSAMGQQAMVIQAIQAGAMDFIVKPFNAERVTEAVSKVLK